MFKSEDIGRRVIYTKRNGEERTGTIRDLATVSATNQMVDVDIEGMSRARFYVPYDSVRFAPEDGTTEE
jgi:hypothetical protein